MMNRKDNQKDGSHPSKSATTTPIKSNLSIPAKARLARELSLLSTDPPPGIACYVVNESNMSKLRAQITIRKNQKNNNSTDDCCYDNGIFMVSIQIPTRYPFEPPHVRFVTPIYHPNIDAAGRICLDTLKSPPAGTWSPAVSLPSLLLTLQTLICEPNPDDALMADIADQYKRNYTEFFREARKRTQLHASSKSYIALEQEIDGITKNHNTTTNDMNSTEVSSVTNDVAVREKSGQNKRVKQSSDKDVKAASKTKLPRTK